MAQDRVERFSRLTIWGRRWFFRGVSANNEIVVPSEGYNSPQARDHGITVAQRIFGAGNFIDVP